jgi:hypothetical protein
MNCSLGGEHGWKRVDRQHPCKVCGKTDWCTYTTDGRIAKCPRVSDGAVKYTDGGYVHIVDASVPAKRYSYEPAPLPQRDEKLALLQRAMMASMTPTILSSWATRLGVSAESLRMLGAGVHRPDVLAFPMVRHGVGLVGIRYRADSGRKWAQTGSKAGLFMPLRWQCDRSRLVMVCEGPTDTAAMLSLGFQCIGRPSAMGQERMVWEALANARHVVVWADDDESGVGYHGAEELVLRKPKEVESARIITPPSKDVREWITGGADRHEVMRWVIPRLHDSLRSSLSHLAQ